MLQPIRTLVVLLLLTLTACATLVNSDRMDRKELLTSQTLDGAYARAQRAAMQMGLHTTETHDTAWAFTARRPTGEIVQVTVQRTGIGTIVTMQGLPAHDVSDLVTAYQHTQ